VAGWGAGIFLSRFREFRSSLVHEFELLWEVREIHSFWVSTIAAQELAVNQLSGGGKNYIVYSLLAIFINSSSISIYFVVLLNCLYLNPEVSPFVHFSSPSHCGGRRGGE